MLAGQATDPEETLPQGRLGVSLGTAAGDAEVFKNEHLSTETPTITGADGKQYPATMA